MGSKSRLVKLLNAKLGTSHRDSDVAFGKPVPMDSAATGSNTKITVSIKTNAGIKRVQAHYNRDNIAVKATNKELYVIVGVDYDVLPSDIVAAVRAEYNLQIFDEDVLEVRETAISPFIRTIIIASESLCWYGSVQVYLVPSDIDLYNDDNRTVIAGYSIPMIRR